MALRLLGASSISSIDGDTENEVTCRTFYDMIRDATLRAHPWNFAIERTSLSLLVDTPLFGWSYQFQLPTDPYCLRVLQMEYPEYKFKIEGRKLLTNESTANILYIARVEDPAQYDSLFVDAFTARMAAVLAYPITGNKGLIETMTVLYEAKIGEAQTMDGMEGSVDSFESTELTEVR